MLTSGFYTALTQLLSRETAGDFYVAVGSGQASWDAGSPVTDPEQTALVSELARKRVDQGDIEYLDGAGNPVIQPTVHLRFRVVFDPAEANGTWRECGLFALGTSAVADSGTLLSYHVHPRLDKTDNTAVARTIHIDLTPQTFADGRLVTRYLGNVRTQELHDLESVTPNCQIDEIRVDHRFYHPDVESALALDYDRCAYCFGPELSRR